jgi:hypothetical protein
VYLPGDEEVVLLEPELNEAGHDERKRNEEHADRHAHQRSQSDLHCTHSAKRKKKKEKEITSIARRPFMPRGERGRTPIFSRPGYTTLLKMGMSVCRQRW